MLPALTLALGFCLPAILIAGSVLLWARSRWLQGLALVAAIACVQWAHFRELAPFTAGLHSSRDGLWLICVLGVALGGLARLRFALGLLGPAMVLVLAWRLDREAWPLWQRALASLVLGLGVIAAARPAAQARSAPALALLLGAAAGAFVLAHSATLGLYAGGLALGVGLVALAHWRWPERELVEPMRAGLASALGALLLCAWLYADLPLASALCLAAGLLTAGLPGLYARTLLVAALCAGAVVPLLLPSASDNPYR